MNVPFRIVGAGTLVWFLLLSPASGQGEQSHTPQNEADRVQRQWFIAKIEELDLAGLGVDPGYTTKQCCELLRGIEEDEIAIRKWEECFQAIKKEKGKAESYALLDIALDMERVDLAQRVIAEADSQRNSMLDRLALYQYQRGDTKALEGYPNGEPKMTFYDAMDLGAVYVTMGQLDKLEQLLDNLEITEENDPEDVVGLLYKKLATDAREAGDLTKAKEYINKSFAVAGRQFYTGYTINVIHKSIHGELVEKADDLAAIARAYRGHMARELSQWLISELNRSGEFELAEKITLSNLEDKEDQATSFARIARQRAEGGDFRGALGLMRRIEDPLQVDRIRMSVAQAMLREGKRDGARELVDLAKQNWLPEKEYRNLHSKLAEFEGAYGAVSGIEAAIAADDDPYRQSLRLVDAFKGFLEAEGSSSLP